MRIHTLRILLSLALASSVIDAQETRGAAPAEKPTFVFREVGYFHRWSKNDQHEFTPEKQEDLEKWADMITINGYPQVRSALRRVANKPRG